MDELIFWKSWNRRYKLFLLAISLLPFSAIIYFLYAYIVGDSLYYSWETIADLDYIYVPTGSFIDHYQEFSTKAYNYVVLESFSPDIVTIDENISHFFIALIGLSFSIFFGLITTFVRKYFYPSLVVGVLLLSFMNLDGLGIFGVTSKIILMAAIIAYLGTAYLLHSFLTETSIIQRISIFIGITALLAFVLYFFSPLSSHAVSLSLIGYGAMFVVPVSVLFIIITAIEPILFLLFMNGNKVLKENRGSIYRFLIASVLYVVLVALLFFNYKAEKISGIRGLDAYLLLFIGSILTFWGFRKRLHSSTRVEDLQFTLLYIALATIGLSSVAYAIITANSPLIRTYTWVITGFYMCYGGAMLVYILYNFYEVLAQKYDVYKVVFKPTRARMYTMWVLGSVMAFALVLKNTNLPYYNAKAGYYNYLGDAYLKQSELDLSREFYEKAKLYSPYNHRSNYCQGNINILQNKYEDATDCFNTANIESPTVHSYISKANIYGLTNKYFEGLFTLEEGLKIFPNNPYLLNNYALMLKKASLRDSALIVLENAQSFLNDDNNGTIYSNMLGISVLGNNLAKAKELSDKNLKERYFQINKNAYQNYIGVKTDAENPFQYGLSLDNTQLAGVINFGFNSENLKDTLTLKNIKKIYENPANAFFREDLDYLLAHMYEKNGDFESAMNQMLEIANSSSPMAYHFSFILGNWFVKQRKYNLAEKYFEMSLKKMPESGYNLALVYMLNNKKASALQLWSQIAATSTEATKKQANMFINLLTTSNVNTLTPEELFNYILFVDASKTELAYNLTDTSSLRPFFEQEYIGYLLKNNNIEKASELLSKYPQNSAEKIELYKAQLLSKQGKTEEALAQMQSMTITQFTEYESLYMKGLTYKNAKQYPTALTALNDLLKKYPFHIDGILLKAEILNLQNKPNEAYEYLISGLYRNESSPELLKAYAMQCLIINMVSYAEETHAKLREMTSEKDYQDFTKVFMSAKADLEKKSDIWE